MIVCWVLFLIATTVGAVGGIGYWHSKGEQDEILEVAVERGWNRFGIIDPANLRPGDVDHGEAPWEKYRLKEKYRNAAGPRRLGATRGLA